MQYKLIIFAILIISISLPSNLAASARKLAQRSDDKKELLGNVSGTARTLMARETKDGASFIDRMLKSAESFNDYSFQYKMSVYHGTKTVVEGGTLWFKQPKLMRLQVTQGPKAGSVAVLETNGKVKAHMGGAMKLFVVNLPPYSNMLKSANGYPFVDSDFISLARETKKFLSLGCVSRVTVSPVTVESQPHKVYVLEVYKGSLDGEIYKRAYIDSQKIVPVEWFDYEGGKLLAHSIWFEFKPNQNLSDEVFTIKGGK